MVYIDCCLILDQGSQANTFIRCVCYYLVQIGIIKLLQMSDCIIMNTEDIAQFVINEVNNRWLDVHIGINIHYEIQFM